MKWFIRNFDPMYVVILGFFGFIGLVFYAEIQIERDRASFSQACIAMGGTPFIGKNDTRVCLKSDAVLSN